MPAARSLAAIAACRRRFLQAMGGGWLLAGVPQLSAADDQRPDRENLLSYRDALGQVQPVRSVEDWLHRRRAIVTAMQEVMGPLPGAEKRIDPNMRIDREIDDGSYVQRVISYAAEPGSRVPAYLLVPKEAFTSETRLPAALAPLGTGMSRTAFSRRALESDGLPHFNGPPNYARTLAERGYVVLVPAYPLLGSYEPDLKRLGYRSGTMKAIWDNIRGLDLLESLPFVRPGRFGTIGHSLGGHNSVYTGVFDERLKVIVCSCGLDSYVDYMDGNIGGWAQERYMPRIADYPLEQIPFDFHEMIAALAPRVCFINAPTGDSNFKWQSAAAVARAARSIFELYHVSAHLRIEHPDAGHQFPEAMQKIAYELFDRHLPLASGR